MALATVVKELRMYEGHLNPILPLLLLLELPLSPTFAVSTSGLTLSPPSGSLPVACSCAHLPNVGCALGPSYAP